MWPRSEETRWMSWSTRRAAAATSVMTRGARLCGVARVRTLARAGSLAS